VEENPVKKICDKIKSLHTKNIILEEKILYSFQWLITWTIECLIFLILNVDFNMIEKDGMKLLF